MTVPEINCELAKAFGIDVENVTSIDLQIRPTNFPLLTVTRIVDGSHVKSMARIKMAIEQVKASVPT